MGFVPLECILSVKGVRVELGGDGGETRMERAATRLISFNHPKIEAGGSGPFVSGKRSERGDLLVRIGRISKARGRGAEEGGEGPGESRFRR